MSIEVVVKSLQEARNSAADDKQELAVLEQQMNQMEAGLLGEFKNAADSRQPIQDLEHLVTELKTIATLLKDSNKCAFAKSLDALREQLNRKLAEFSEKCKSSTSGKSEYLAMIKDIGVMQARLAAVTSRLQMLQADSERLAGRTSEWINIYRDSVAFLGESEARTRLKDLLRNDPLTAKQFETPRLAASNSEAKRQSVKPVDPADGSRRVSENPVVAQPNTRKSLPTLMPPLQHSESRDSDAGAQAPKTGAWNGAAAIAPMEGERFPETRLRHLDQAYAEKLSMSELRYAINEMFARHGAEFPQKELSALFLTRKWYRPRPGVSYDQIEEHEFSEVERLNVKILGDARDLKSTGRAAAVAPATVPMPNAQPPRKLGFPTIIAEDGSTLQHAAGPGIHAPLALKPGRSAIIDDQDGWSNLRQGPSSNSPIIRRILQNEVFYVLGTNGAWCRVVTGNNQYGWVHNSVIKFTE